MLGGCVREKTCDTIQKKLKKCTKVNQFNLKICVFLLINIDRTCVKRKFFPQYDKKSKIDKKSLCLSNSCHPNQNKNKNNEVNCDKSVKSTINRENNHQPESLCADTGFPLRFSLGCPRRCSSEDDRCHVVQGWPHVRSAHLQTHMKGDIKKSSEVKLKLILNCGDIETNPGPLDISPINKQNLIIATYNVQGLNNMHKVKRVFNVLNKLEFKNNCIINLQETHLTKSNIFRYHWKGDYVASGGSRASCGVAILFNPSYFDTIISKKVDDDGRFCSFTASKNLEVYHFVNIYAPNNHYESQNFFNSLKQHLDEVNTQHPLANIIISGDFNVVFDPNVDSIGRNQNRQEIKVLEIINQIKILHNLIDTYRSIHKYGGFTWKRNNPTYLRSRLDYILASKNLANKLISSAVSYSFVESDHSFLFTELDIGNVRYGPGIIKCNATILDDEVTRTRIMNNVNKKMNEDTGNYNPHEKLDYYKYLLRVEILKEGKIIRNVEKSRLEISNEEIAILNKKLDQLLLERQNNNAQNDDSIENVRLAIEIAEEPIKDLKSKEAKKLIFRSKAKWAEEGEKSTKYFLNLLKYRQNKMILRKITANGQTFHKQDEISKAIETFYKNLYTKQPNLKPVENDDNTLFADLPQLNEEDKSMLSQAINLDELRSTLGTCEDSAPGPDGIPYSVYKKTWNTSGKLILDAWNYSLQTGEVSMSQKQSIITLLDKKGKDNSIITNLRPISLSNCDIKLCTKTIALRTNKVLYKLLSITQTGYVPNRQVTNNNRLIEEIIDMSAESDEELYLITLDAQKAFDSVDHHYLLSILKKYNFPDSYIHCVKTIYTNLEASVLVNGYTTNRFKIQQSVKQGDALSCSLFVLAIEPLLRKLNSNPIITPISLYSLDNDGLITFNTIAYADDITCITKNKDAIQEVINEYSNFSMFSGISLNVAKTEILIIGKKDQRFVQFDITYRGNNVTLYDQDEVTICGISFSNNKEISYAKNIENKILKLERQLNIWKQRNLTFFGKCLIAKTFGLSQLIYSLQSTTIKKEDLKRIEDILFRFIWNTKSTSSRVTHKISKKLMQCSRDNGGINAPNIELINQSFKYKALLNSNLDLHPVNTIYQNKLRLRGFNFKYYKCAIDKHDFIGEGIKMHILVGKKLLNDIKTICTEDTGIHRNYYGFIQNINIFETGHTNVYQQNTLHRLITNNIDNVVKLYNAKQMNTYPNLFLDIHQVYSQLPKEWITILGKARSLHQTPSEVYIGLNKWKNRNKVTVAEIKNIFCKELELVNHVKRKHSDTLNNVDFKNPFKNLRMLKDVKLCNIQFKLLHNIYPTMSHLFKWKLKDTDKCALCNVVQTVYHAIYDCPTARECIRHIEQIINRRLSTNIKLRYDQVLLGTMSTIDYENQLIKVTKGTKVGIDTFLILYKQLIILQRENKRFVTIEELENVLNERINLDLYNDKKYKTGNKNSAKWFSFR